MKQLIIVVLIVAAIGFVAVNFGEVKTNQVDFERVVGERLEMVELNNADAVRTQLVKDAKKYKFDLKPSDILVKYERTEDQKYAQGFVAGLAEFENWRATIELNYTSHLLGFTSDHPVTVSKIKQVQVRQKLPPAYEPYKELLSE